MVLWLLYICKSIYITGHGRPSQCDKNHVEFLCLLCIQDERGPQECLSTLIRMPTFEGLILETHTSSTCKFLQCNEDRQSYHLAMVLLQAKVTQGSIAATSSMFEVLWSPPTRLFGCASFGLKQKIQQVRQKKM